MHTDEEFLNVGSVLRISLYIVFDVAFLYYMFTVYPAASFLALFLFSPLYFLILLGLFSPQSKKAIYFGETAMLIYKVIIITGWGLLFSKTYSFGPDFLTDVMPENISTAQMAYTWAYVFWLGLGMLLAMVSVWINSGTLIVRKRFFGFRNSLATLFSVLVIFLLGLIIYLALN